MHVLTVFAHPNRASFAGAILDAFMHGAEAAGHSLDLSDLYREDFNPVFSAKDFDFFRERDPMPEDVKAIHDRIVRAQALAFVFPVWWWSAPAILKGWFERVLINEFAWNWDGHKIVPGLSSKKVVMLCPAGSSTRTYDKRGYEDVLVRQVAQGIWNYCGLDDIETYLMPDIDASEESRRQHLQTAERVGRKIGA